MSEGASALPANDFVVAVAIASVKRENLCLTVLGPCFLLILFTANEGTKHEKGQ